MTANEACKILIESLKFDAMVLSCYEYNSIYVFEAIPKKYASTKEPIFDSLYSVDKETGEILSFKPFDMSVEEYMSGKEIEDF